MVVVGLKQTASVRRKTMHETWYIIMNAQYGKEIVDETEDMEKAMQYCYEYELGSGIPHEVKRADATSSNLVHDWEM